MNTNIVKENFSGLFRKLILQIIYKNRKLSNLFVKNNVNNPIHISMHAK